MCPFLRVKEERARWSSATGDDGFCSWPPSRITDEKGFGGPFLWRVSSKGPASMHLTCLFFFLLLPSIHVTRAPFPPLIASNPAPLADHRFRLVLLSLSGHVSFCAYDSFFFSSSSLGDIIGCMISFWEFFHHAHAAWRYLSDWCMARF